MSLIEKLMPKKNLTKADLELEQEKRVKQGQRVSNQGPITKIDPYKYPHVTINKDGTFSVWVYDAQDNLNPVTASYNFSRLNNSDFFSGVEKHFSMKNQGKLLPKLTLSFESRGTSLDIMVDGKDLYVQDSDISHPETFTLVKTDIAQYDNSRRISNNALNVKEFDLLANQYMKLFDEYSNKLNVSKLKKASSVKYKR